MNGLPSSAAYLGVLAGVRTSWRLWALQCPPTLMSSDWHLCLVDGLGVLSLGPWEGVRGQRWRGLTQHTGGPPESRVWPADAAGSVPPPGSRKTHASCPFWPASQAKAGVLGAGCRSGAFVKGFPLKPPLPGISRQPVCVGRGQPCVRRLSPPWSRCVVSWSRDSLGSFG